MLEPFLGIGHAAIAAGNWESASHRFEIDEGYLAEARRRVGAGSSHGSRA